MGVIAQIIEGLASEAAVPKTIMTEVSLPFFDSAAINRSSKSRRYGRSGALTLAELEVPVPGFWSDNPAMRAMISSAKPSGLGQVTVETV